MRRFTCVFVYIYVVKQAEKVVIIIKKEIRSAYCNIMYKYFI